MSAERSATGVGSRPFFLSVSETKVSMGCPDAGTGLSLGTVKAQCDSYLAPCRIQALMVALSCALSFRCDFGWGMTSSGSSLMIRCQTSLLARSPGTIGVPPLCSRVASSGRSSRSLALRDFSSKPWQEKQFSERMGRISRLKANCGSAACSANGNRQRGRSRRTEFMGLLKTWTEAGRFQRKIPHWAPDIQVESAGPK